MRVGAIVGIDATTVQVGHARAVVGRGAAVLGGDRENRVHDPERVQRIVPDARQIDEIQEGEGLNPPLHVGTEEIQDGLAQRPPQQHIDGECDRRGILRSETQHPQPTVVPRPRRGKGWRPTRPPQQTRMMGQDAVVAVGTRVVAKPFTQTARMRGGPRNDAQLLAETPEGIGVVQPDRGDVQRVDELVLELGDVA